MSNLYITQLKRHVSHINNDIRQYMYYTYINIFLNEVDLCQYMNLFHFLIGFIKG